MTMVETLRRRTGGSSDVVDRLAGLDQAVQAARGHLDDGLVDEGAQIVERAGERLRLSSEHTVVALAGATGSGKSSLFNWLCGLDLAGVGIKRPTTSWTLACAWGPTGANELLNWLGIPARHQVNRMGMLDETAADRDLQGLVLLDLPDHDSTEVAHHLEVERLVKLADVLVWVLDPQKYADAAIHDRFLRPLHAHSDVMMVALNHIDEIPEAEVDRCLNDVRRLLHEDGLHDVPVFATSARRGDGLDELRNGLIERVSAKQLARERLAADIKTMAARLHEATGSAQPPDVRDSARGELVDAALDAAAVPVVVESIRTASALQARRATGWPPTSWMTGGARDPMKSLGLPDSGPGGDPVSAADLRAMRTRVPEPNAVQRARLDSAVRDIADRTTADMPPAWESAVRSASIAKVDQFATGLDEAVAHTDLGLSSTPWWWRAVQGIQWLFLVAVLAGVGWLLAVAAMSVARDPDPTVPKAGGVWVPVIMVVGGLAGGLVLAVLGRIASAASARARARHAEQQLRGSINRVTDIVIVGPMQDEVDAYLRCRDGIATALKP
ncbi:MAG TPA: GTPase [Nocardioidaceae bacterium]|nr:GTPase [Nocardioidaceae bacterium]